MFEHLAAVCNVLGSVVQTEWPRVEHDLDKKHGEEIRHACLCAVFNSVQDGISGLHKLTFSSDPLS